MSALSLLSKPYALPTHDRRVSQGTGYSYGHCGEILQGMFDHKGRIVRGLVTLPCYSIGTSVAIKKTVGNGDINLPPDKTKIKRAIKEYLNHHSIPPAFDITLIHTSTIPIGVGMGSSTSDIIATVRALDKAFKRTTTPLDTAKLALHAERASDSLMLGKNCCLFAQRDGFILEDFAQTLPNMTVVAINTDPEGDFDTDATPAAEYSPNEVLEFERLRSALSQGIKCGDLKTVAAVASASSEINQRYFPKKRFYELQHLGRKLGSLGISVAHSGTIAALIFQHDRHFETGFQQRVWSELTSSQFHPFGIFTV